jgi:hypothetical protein
VGVAACIGRFFLHNNSTSAMNLESRLFIIRLILVCLWNKPQPALSPNQMQKQKISRLQKRLEDGEQG